MSSARYLCTLPVDSSVIQNLCSHLLTAVIGDSKPEVHIQPQLVGSFGDRNQKPSRVDCISSCGTLDASTCHFSWSICYNRGAAMGVDASGAHSVQPHKAHTGWIQERACAWASPVLLQAHGHPNNCVRTHYVSTLLNWQSHGHERLLTAGSLIRRTGNSTPPPSPSP